MFRQSCPQAEALVAFLYDEFDGTETFDRRAIARHLDGCVRCTAEVASLGGVRQTLREWAAPEMTLGFRVVAEPPRRFAWLPAWSVPMLPLAAAATLVLGGALGLARLDIQYDAQGLRMRTGWGHGDGVASGSAANAGATTASADSARADSARANSANSAAGVANAGFGSASGASSRVGIAPVPAVATDAAGAPWRGEMQALERQMRLELAALRRGDRGASDRVTAANALAGDPSTPAGEQALLRRIQQLIDQSEVRQQQNLALRAAELSRAFDLQRRSDLVQIEQGFGRLADQRAQDAESQRQFLNAIRVSQQPR